MPQIFKSDFWDSLLIYIFTNSILIYNSRIFKILGISRQLFERICHSFIILQLESVTIL